MDFPLILDTGTFVYGIEELRQTITALLKVRIARWLQDNKIGSYVSIHSNDVELLEESTQATIQQIDGLTAVSVTANTEGQITAVVRYRGQVQEFQFNVNSL